MEFLYPTYYVHSLPQVDLEQLAREGVRCILLDRDNTCVPRDTKMAPTEVMVWLKQAREQGMHLCMVSNNIHSDQVRTSAEALGIDCVGWAMKPTPFAVRRALVLEGVPAEQAVMIGDQMLTDVTAGNLAGLKTILVRPQSQVDLWYTQLFRVVEHHLLARRCFKGEERH